MASPNIDINVFDASVYTPRVSDVIFGCIGPAVKGPVNQLLEFTDEGGFVNTFGRPVDGHYGPRATIRFQRKGDQLKFVRVAGPNVAAATLTLYAADGKTPILNLTATSKGTWANSDLRVAVTHNGAASYNLYVHYRGQLVEQFLVLTNGIVVTRVAAGSSRITVALANGAGSTFPAQTVDAITGQVVPRAFSGGDDGAFAGTASASSSTGGVAGKRFYGQMNSVGGSRVWHNLLTIGASLAGKTIVHSTVGMPVVPGTFTVRVQTAGGPTFIELADNGNLTYTPGGAGLGILTPSVGAHVGYIDYRTGAWGVKIDAATLFSGGTIDAIYIRANSESVGSTVKGTGAYAGNISGASGVGHWSANKVVLTVPISEGAGTHTAGGATTASSTPGMKALAGWIVPGTVKLTPVLAGSSVPSPVYDDGFGGWRTLPGGAGIPVTGTINYRTGVWTVTWEPTGPAMPANGTVTAAYDINTFPMGGGAVAGATGTYVTDLVVQANAVGGTATVHSAEAGAVAITLPIVRGTVRLVISATSGGPFTCYDDGLGNLLTLPRGTPGAATVTGSVNYDTGAWTITLGGGTVTATATVKASYVAVAGDRARRALRGTGTQALGAGGANAAGLSLALPTSADNFDGPNFFDHRTGAFKITLTLVPEAVGLSFDVKNGGTISAVYAPTVGILGFGDGAATSFTGTLAPAPFRRGANRLLGFQSAQASAAGSGEAQVTFATLGASASLDTWSQNVSAVVGDNALSFATGTAKIKWTAAPLAEEAVFVVAEEVVLDFTCKYPGDIGNERAVLTDGFNVLVDADPTLANTLRAQVVFNGTSVESFGQADSVDALVVKINDESRYVTAASRGAAGFIPVDTGASQRSGLAGAFTQADVIGTKVGQVVTGLQLFANDETVPLDWVMTPGQWHRSVILALQTLCEKKGRRCLAIIPAPDLDDPLVFRDFFNGNYNAAVAGGVAVPSVLVPFPPLVAIDSKMLVTAIPWVTYYDQYAAAPVREPADGEVASLVAGAPAPWQPIAGLRHGRVLADDVAFSTSREERDLIHGLVGTTVQIVNPIINKVGRGLVMYGQRTAMRADTAAESRINVRWTLNVIMNLIDARAQEYVFTLNDSFLWREIEADLNALVKPVLERRGLQDAFVQCNGKTTTPDMIDALRVGAKLFVKPARAAEYIGFDIILTPTGADFASVVVAG